MQKPLLKKYNSLDVVSYSIWGATLFLLFFIKGSAQEIQSANLSSLLAVIYLGVFPGAIAYLCWSYALSSMPASKISSFLYIVPIITMIIGLIFLNELPSVISIIGGSVVLTGVFIVHRAKKN